MADKKISQLTSAVLPLVGTELVPVVQSGATKQTTVSAISAGATFTPAGTGAVVRTVQDKLRESVSVKDFGAAGNGVADDTAEIQAAINYVSALPGSGRVYFPQGNYVISSTLLLTRNIILEGESWYDGGDISSTATCIKLANGSNCDMIRTKYASSSYNRLTDYVFGSEIKNIAFDGNAANQTAVDPVTLQNPVIINAQNWFLSSIKNCSIFNSKSYGIYVNTNYEEVVVDNCRIYNNSSGIYVRTLPNSAASPNGFRVSNSVISNNYYYGIHSYSTDSSSDTSVLDNVSFSRNKHADVYADIPLGLLNFILISPKSIGNFSYIGEITSGTNTLTITTNSFVSTDVDSIIQVNGAGAAGANLQARVTSVVAANQVTLSSSASTTVTNGIVYQGAFVKVVYDFTKPAITILGATRIVNRPMGVWFKNQNFISDFTLNAKRNFFLTTEITNDLTWAYPVLQNSWTNVGSPYALASCIKDAAGVVHIRGVVTGGTSGAQILSFPSTFTSSTGSQRLAFTTSDVTKGAAASFYINNGTLYHLAGATTDISINCSFKSD